MAARLAHREDIHSHTFLDLAFFMHHLIYFRPPPPQLAVAESSCHPRFVLGDGAHLNPANRSPQSRLSGPQRQCDEVTKTSWRRHEERRASAPSRQGRR